MAKILDGRSLAKKIREELKLEVQKIKERGIIPSLAVVLVGDNPSSVVYVNMKRKACEEVGISSHLYQLPADSTEKEVVELVRELGARKDITGILVQHPLPPHIDELAVFSQIPLEKDVDGLSPLSLGRLAFGRPVLVSCTALGVLELLKHYQIPIEGKEAVVIGRSIIVGKPVALLLLQANATVTICHSRTQNLWEKTSQADILVVGIGKPEYVRGEHIKEGAVVIDCGYNRPPGANRDVGDVHFPSAQEKASYITPVPGGVGPMTIAMLLKNTIKALEVQL
ncbi:bifunctional methylenetetrahydrofolate dehydrogenase/methenyltetrahydrofolate cyclohydrolase FolD [bacterium]|nr:bifunctional methylenetetrahydrofolate dehydrogenase/methenyltetrahydrofolate cyclohydrolase FolD [bacterium]